MKAVRYLLMKIPKLTMLDLTKLGLWEADSIIRNMIKASYR